MKRPTINRRALFADLGYEPHAGQRAIHDSTASRRVVAYSVRWGKTQCAAIKKLAATLAPNKRSYG